VSTGVAQANPEQTAQSMNTTDTIRQLKMKQARFSIEIVTRCLVFTLFEGDQIGQGVTSE
jgi:hypothetical protein